MNRNKIEVLNSDFASENQFSPCSIFSKIKAHPFSVRKEGKFINQHHKIDAFINQPQLKISSFFSHFLGMLYEI